MGGCSGGGGPEKVIFYYESKFNFGGKGARVSEFFTKNPNLKYRGEEGGGGKGLGVGIDRQTDEQAQTILPLQVFRSWGHNNA